ncbi:jg15882, partial [Pararge aegeria aegeria]
AHVVLIPSITRDDTNASEIHYGPNRGWQVSIDGQIHQGRALSAGQMHPWNTWVTTCGIKERPLAPSARAGEGQEHFNGSLTVL